MLYNSKYIYFYRVEVLHSKTSNKIVYIKSPSMLSPEQAVKFLAHACIITWAEEKLDVILLKPISKEEYNSKVTTSKFSIKSMEVETNNSEVFEEIEGDLGDLIMKLFDMVHHIKLFKPYIRALMVEDKTMQQKRKLEIRHQ